MTEILNLGDWILEEVPQPAAGTLKKSLQQQQPLPPRVDAQRCYWLIRASSKNDDDDDSSVSLCVHCKDEDKNLPLEHYTGNNHAQIFRLSFRGHSDDESKVNENSEPHLQPHESPNIGTKLLFEDERIKIWEFRLAPGQPCLFHRHVRPYFFLNLTASQNQELNPQGVPVPNTLPSVQTAGQCTYVTRDKLGAHAVRNVSDNLFLQFIVEFK